MLPKIFDWMTGKTIFITGATGYLGKVLLEKLLRDCSALETIYILLRDKKSLDATARLRLFQQNVIFQKITSINSTLIDKVHAIAGNICLLNLGLSESDYDLLTQSVDVIIHVAASVRFNMTLEEALNLNVKGTLEVLKLGESMRNLKSFVFVSTAYSNVNEKIIEEKVYKPIVDHRNLFDRIFNDDVAMKILEERVLSTFPNMYVFSKNIAENLVSDYSTKIPTVIVRPSIVCPSVREPFPGWVDSFNGPIGVLVGAGAGIIRTVHGSGNIIPDLLPVDLSANSIIAAAVYVGHNNHISECRVLNTTTSTDMPITWNQFLELGRESNQDFPSSEIVWYPNGQMNSSYFIHLVFLTLTQFIPACFLDLVHILLRKKPRMINLQRQIFNSLKHYDFFLNKQWHWENFNVHQMYSSMHPTDRYTFNFIADKLDYYTYIQNIVIGTRKFLLKQNESTVPAAKRKMKLLYLTYFAIKVVIFLLVTYLLLQMVTLIGHTENIPGINVIGKCKKCERINIGF